MKALKFFGAVLSLAITGAVCFGAGQRNALSSMAMDLLFSTSMRVETASRVRTDDLAGALLLLEAQIDAAIIKIANGAFGPPDLREQVLAQAKLYRTAVPPTEKRNEISRALADVSTDVDLYSCPVPAGRPIRASGLMKLTAQTSHLATPR